MFSAGVRESGICRGRKSHLDAPNVGILLAIGLPVVAQDSLAVGIWAPRGYTPRGPCIPNGFPPTRLTLLGLSSSLCFYPPRLPILKQIRDTQCFHASSPPSPHTHTGGSPSHKNPPHAHHPFFLTKLYRRPPQTQLIVGRITWQLRGRE